VGASLICVGCGARFRVPDDHTRNKIRCPECGVFNPVPSGPFPTEEAPPPRSAKAAPVRASDDEDRAARLLDEIVPPAPSQPARPAVKTEPAGKPQAPAPAVEDEEDGKPYLLQGGEPRYCPQCRGELEGDVILCVRCGYDLVRKEKTQRKYQPIQRTFSPGWPLQKRLTVFLLIAFATGALSISAASTGVPARTALGSWALFCGLMAFLLGTFDRLELTRDRRGRVRLLRTWRICFIEWPTREINLAEFNGLSAFVTTTSGCAEWFVCLTLLIPFVIPGLIWWWQVLRRGAWELSLTRDHGYPAVILYRGHNEDYVVELARAIEDAAYLPFQKV